MQNEDPPIIDYCKYCEARVHFLPLYVHALEAEDGCDEEYTLVECSLCHKPALFYREEMRMAESLDWEPPVHEIVYPQSDRQRGLDFSVPLSVSKSYYEAASAEDAKLWLSAQVMVGRTLEAICKHFCPGAKSIFDGLEEIYRQGLLSKQMLDWSHDLRLLRNLAAHTNDQEVGEWDVSTSLDFLQALLTMLFKIAHDFKTYKDSKT